MRDVLFDRGRMRFFLRIVADVSESDELLSIVAAHGRSLGTAIAPVFGRSPDDPDILAFVDLMRGRAMRHLLHPEQPVPDRSEMIADAARLSLKRAQSDGQNRSEEYTSALQSLMRISYAVFCLKKKTKL